MDPYHMNNNSHPTQSSRAEADRWLAIAEKLLSTRDLVGSKTFAIRARESEPRLEAADQILALADTLIAGDKRINNSLPDWYAVLQLPPLTADVDLIAAHYRGLAILLNPNRSRLCFADQAFQLVSDAWSVLSNPSRKSIYDNEIAPQQLRFGDGVNVNVNMSGNVEGNSFGNPSYPQNPQNPRLFENNVGINMNNTINNNNNNNESNASNVRIYDNELHPPPIQNEKDEVSPERVGNNGSGVGVGETFWTACPYCYNMYEYPKAYEECTMRCQNCRRAFHGAKIPAPPVEGGDSYTTWGFYPLGVSMSMMEKNKGGVANWTPFSPMFACSKVEEAVEKKRGRRPGPVVYIEDEDDDDDMFFDSEPSEGSDDEWGSTRTRKKKSGRRGRVVKRGGGGRNLRSNTEGVVDEGVQEGIGIKEVATLGKKLVGKAMKERGKLDLNVEFNNEGEEPVRGRVVTRPAHGEEDGGIEGIGFFEGLDEFLSSLPILNVVGDEKVKAV